MKSFFIELDGDGRSFYVRKYGAMVQHWSVMQQIIGSILLGIIFISASERLLMYWHMKH